MRRAPERTDLLLLAPGGPGLLLRPQFDELFEAFGFGVTAPCLPLCDGATGNPKLVGQISLCQADLRPHSQHQLTEGIVALTVRVSLHSGLHSASTIEATHNGGM